MAQRRRFSTEYEREAVLGRWRRELRQESARASRGKGRPRDENLALLRRELARVTKERGGGCEKRQRSSREHRDEVSDDPTMPHRVSHPDDVPVFAGLVQWLLWPGDPVAEWAGQENALLLGRIHQLHAEQDGVVGSPRIWEDLRYAGERCGRHRVARLCVELGVQGVPQQRRWRKQPTGTRLSETRNHLERDFTTAAPNTKWVTDITYIRTAEH